MPVILRRVMVLVGQVSVRGWTATHRWNGGSDAALGCTMNGGASGSPWLT